MFLRIFIFLLSILSIYLLPNYAGVNFWDEAIVAFFAAHRSESLTKFFLLITYIGSTWGFLVVLILPWIYLLAKKRWETAFYYLFGVGFLKLSVNLLKIWIGRPRPEDSVLFLKTYSMPSGHSANAVIIYGVLAMFLMQKSSTGLGRFLAFVFCLIMILLTDLSRVYLGVHYPSDVLIGSLYTACGLWVLQGIRKDVFIFSPSK